MFAEWEAAVEAGYDEEADPRMVAASEDDGQSWRSQIGSERKEAT